MINFISNFNEHIIFNDKKKIFFQYFSEGIKVYFEQRVTMMHLNKNNNKFRQRKKIYIYTHERSKGYTYTQQIDQARKSNEWNRAAKDLMCQASLTSLRFAHTITLAVLRFSVTKASCETSKEDIKKIFFFIFFIYLYKRKMTRNRVAICPDQRQIAFISRLTPPPDLPLYRYCYNIYIQIV